MKVDQISRLDIKLAALHKDAEQDFSRVRKGQPGTPMTPMDFENVYLPISQKQGEGLRQLIIDNNCKHVLEFGTSFGISTIYLADGVRQTGGKVVTTELLVSKAKKAKSNIEDVGLLDFVEIRIGDAMKTLQFYSDPIDLLFLDGWKDLYLPLFQLLKPQFHSGTIIYADNMDMAGTRAYGEFVLKNSQSYSSELIHTGKGLLTIVK